MRKISRLGILAVAIFCMGASLFAQGINVDLGKSEYGRYMKLVGNIPGSPSEILNTQVAGEYCAENVGTTMYFDLDNQYMFQRQAGTFVLVNVEYFDADGNIKIKLQYDALTDPAKIYDLNIQTAGSKTWKAFNFFLDDAYLSDRLPNSADLALVCDNGKMQINRVNVVPIDYYIDFGTVNDEYFITQKEVQGGDSKTIIQIQDGEECITTTLNDQYLYCGVDDSVIYNGNHPNLFVAVEYYDADPLLRMRLQYDSFDKNYQSTAYVNCKGWGSFRTYTFEISNAKFSNRENGGSDFRLQLSRPGMLINRITIGICNTGLLPATNIIPEVSTFKALESPSVDGQLIDWDWLNGIDIIPEFNVAGKRTDEFYRTWLLNPENVPVAEVGEPGVTDPQEAGLWDTRDLSGTFRSLWDDSTLYFALTVTDNVHDVDGEAWQEQDGFGVYLDISHDYVGLVPVPRRDDLSFQEGEYFLFFPADDSKPGQWFHKNAPTGENLPETILRKTVLTGDGYLAELAIPLQLLRGNLAWNPDVANDKDDFNPLFAYVLNDADGVGKSSGRLMYAGHSADDEFWGRLNFEGIPLVDRGMTIDLGEPNFEQFLKQVNKGGDGLTEIVECRGKKAAKSNGGYIYLDVDDAIITGGNHPHLLIMIEYYDAAESEKFRIQYDAADNPYKDLDWITVGNSQTWRSAIIEIADANFSGRQSQKADLRIHCPTQNLIVNQVRIAIADLWIDLGQSVTQFGMEERNLGGDGTRAPAQVGGLDCKRNTNGEAGGGRYFYIGVTDSLIFSGNHPELFVTVEYYDTTSSGGVSLNYDGKSNTWSNGEGFAFITGSNQWKLHTFYLNDAFFANRENGGSDFRATGMGDGYSFINRILIGSVTPLSTGLDQPQSSVYTFDLEQNYPNPFNPSTTIIYGVAKRCAVTLEIYNILGQRIYTLVDEVKAPGSYVTRWNGLNASGFKVPSGLYFCRFTAANYVKTTKMMVLK